MVDEGFVTVGSIMGSRIYGCILDIFWLRTYSDWLILLHITIIRCVQRSDARIWRLRLTRGSNEAKNEWSCVAITRWRRGISRAKETTGSALSLTALTVIIAGVVFTLNTSYIRSQWPSLIKSINQSLLHAQSRIKIKMK